MRKSFIKALSFAMAAAISFSAMVMPVTADFEKSDKGISYTDDNGKKVTGLKTIDGKTYYFDKNGIAKTGFMKFKAGTRYFDSEGVMKTGWVKINKKYYYFTKKGIMATGKYNIGSKQYTFDKNGVWDGKQGKLIIKYDYRKSNWGDTLKDVQKAENNKCVKLTDTIYALKNKVKLSEKSYDTTFCFDEKTGKLQCGAYMNYELSGKKAYVKEFETMYDSLKKKYGNPFVDGRSNPELYEQSPDTESVIDGNIVIWKYDDTYVALLLFNADDGQTCLMIGYFDDDYFGKSQYGSVI